MKKMFEAIGKFFLRHYYITMCFLAILLLIITVSAIAGIGDTAFEMMIALSMFCLLYAGVNLWNYKHGYAYAPKFMGIDFFPDYLRDFLERNNQLEQYEYYRAKRAILGLFASLMFMALAFLSLLFLKISHYF